jgi:aldehyde:ferredoxin oxidoreductase
MADGLADKMIRVDMTTQTATVESFPAKWRLLGGRALSARILVEECDPKCEPLGPGNVLVIAPGVMSGTSADFRHAPLAAESDRRHQI